MDLEVVVPGHVAVMVKRMVAAQLYGGNKASFSNVRAEIVDPEILDTRIIPGAAKKGEEPPTVRQVCEANRITLARIEPRIDSQGMGGI